MGVAGVAVVGVAVAGVAVADVAVVGVAVVGVAVAGVAVAGVGVAGVAVADVAVASVGMARVAVVGVGMAGVGVAGVGMAGVGMARVRMARVRMAGVGVAGVGACVVGVFAFRMVMRGACVPTPVVWVRVLRGLIQARCNLFNRMRPMSDGGFVAWRTSRHALVCHERDGMRVLLDPGLGFEQLGLVICRKRRNDIAQIAVHNRWEIVFRQADAVIGDAILRVIVRADFFRTIAAANLCLTIC